METKPQVDIEEAKVITYEGIRILTGYPVNHPRVRLNGNFTYTSWIVNIEGNRVETINTMYNVLSWSDEPLDKN